MPLSTTEQETRQQVHLGADDAGRWTRSHGIPEAMTAISPLTNCGFEEKTDSFPGDGQNFT